MDTAAVHVCHRYTELNYMPHLHWTISECEGGTFAGSHNKHISELNINVVISNFSEHIHD